LLDAIVEALRNAGATDEVVAAAVGAYVAWGVLHVPEVGDGST
jgi:hypothetical protein